MQAAGPTIAAASRPPSRKPKTKELPSDYEVFLRPPTYIFPLPFYFKMHCLNMHTAA